MPRSGKGCTGYHAEKTLYTELTAKRQLPADRYLPMDESLAAFTEILRSPNGTSRIGTEISGLRVSIEPNTFALIST